MAKCQLISDNMSLSMVTYYQKLNHFVEVEPDDVTLLDTPLLTAKTLNFASKKKNIEFKCTSERF